MLPLDTLAPLVMQLNLHPAWRDFVSLLRDWVTREALDALAPQVDEFTRGRIAGIRQLVLELDAARLSAQQRAREAAELREGRRLDPLVVPGEYDPNVTSSVDSSGDRVMPFY